MRRNGAAALAVGVALILTACSKSSHPSPASTSITVPPAATATTITTATGQQPAAAVGPEGVPIPDGPPLGLPRSDGQTIDGIKCETHEQVAYHIHAHLTVFVNGRANQVPYGIGIAPPTHVAHSASGDFVDSGSCFYWLHTHAGDGIMHIESPTQQIYTLGQFFDVWGQNLAPGQVGTNSGQLTMFVNGQPYTANPRDIPLAAHGEIQLDLGAVVPPQSVDWSQTGL